MVYRLLDFARIFLKLLMFKVCGNIGILKIEFLNFSGTESVKQNPKNSKTTQNFLSLYVNHFSSNFSKIQIFFRFFNETLTLWFPIPRRVDDNTNLSLTSNIRNTVNVNIAFTRKFFKEYSISFVKVCRLIDFALVVFKLLMFKVCGIIGISKIKFFIFSWY